MSMTEHPLIVQDWGVRAIRAGTKTQTRRVVIPQPIIDADGGCWYPHKDHKKAKHYANESHLLKGFDKDFSSPYGVPGDNLWVKETLVKGAEVCGVPKVLYAATRTPIPYTENMPRGICGVAAWTWKCDTLSAMFMPRLFSRIDLTNKSRGVERVQDMGETFSRNKKNYKTY